MGKINIFPNVSSFFARPLKYAIQLYIKQTKYMKSHDLTTAKIKDNAKHLPTNTLDSITLVSD